MVFSDDFLHFLKIKKKFVEFTKTILWPVAAPGGGRGGQLPPPLWFTIYLLLLFFFFLLLVSSVVSHGKDSPPTPL